MRLTKKEIAEQNAYLLRRQREFHTAAEFVAQALAGLPEVQKVVLFGSVAEPLEKEVPRFREFRRAGVEVYHECKDVDLAVWVTSLDDLKSLQRARSGALNALWQAHQIGVAHHQVDIFLIEPASDRYLGRLCSYGKCPKGKFECSIPACGAKPFLKQHEDFTLNPQAFAPDSSEVLHDRTSDGMFPPDNDGAPP